MLCENYLHFGKCEKDIFCNFMDAVMEAREELLDDGMIQSTEHIETPGEEERKHEE